MAEILTLELMIGGILSLLYVIVTTITGSLIISKYFKYKEKAFLYIGIATVGISSPWWPSTLSFFSILFTQERLAQEVYFIVGVSFIPVFAFFWILGLNILVFNGKNKILIGVVFILFCIVEIAFFTILIIDPSQIGSLAGPVDVLYNPFIMSILGILIFIVLATGLVFSTRSLKSSNPEIQAKGKVLTIAFLIWGACAHVDAIFALPIPLLLVLRGLLILTAMQFYIGWILPEFSKKVLKKIGLLNAP
ncbi:MAG: hypothetical protein JW891_06085 [Candidatus Lokiarchaeota archaeon]|nr:hypothetical protein [Candidatus Lokiarchaeota archaeon]